jgi:hypothetical protein
VPITKPGLGLSADYGLPPTPNTSLPDPLAKSTWSLNYSKAGVDSGEIIIRGGSHLDFSFIPNQAFGASYYGPDIIDWYTTGWFDKYLKHSPEGDRMLLSERWRDYAPEAAIDPNHDGNGLSFYYDSRLDIHLDNGRRWDCEDLRDGCAGMVPTSEDGYSGNYSYVNIDTTPDAIAGAAAPLKRGNSIVGCPSRYTTKFTLSGYEGHSIIDAKAYVNGRLVRTETGSDLTSISIPGVPGRARNRETVKEYTVLGYARTLTRYVYGCAR